MLAISVPILGISAIIVSAAAALFGAWLGGRLQQSGNLESLALQLQIDAAGNFLGAVADFIAVLTTPIQFSPLSAQTLVRGNTSSYRGPAAVLSARAAEVSIVGPDELVELAQAVVIAANAAAYGGVSGGRNRVAEIRALQEEFARSATTLLRPMPARRQKNGRSRSDSESIGEAENPS